MLVLHDSRTLVECNITHGCSLKLVLKMQSAITSYASVIEPSLDLTLDVFALQNIDVFDVTGLDSSERDELLAMFFGSSPRSIVVCKDGDVLSFYQEQSPLPEESDTSDRITVRNAVSDPHERFLLTCGIDTTSFP